MRPLFLILICAPFFAGGCLKHYATFSGRVLVAKKSYFDRRPIEGALVTIRVPSRIFRTNSNARGGFYLRYHPGMLNVEDLTGWVAFAERKGYYTDILRIGRGRGPRRRLRKHDFLLIENRTNEPADLLALRKALRYLGEPGEARKTFAINALGMLAVRSGCGTDKEIQAVLETAVTEIGAVLTGSGKVKLRRLAARKIGLFPSVKKLDALRMALDDEDRAVVYWTVRSLADELGCPEKAFDRGAAQSERKKSVDYFRGLLGKLKGG